MTSLTESVPIARRVTDELGRFEFDEAVPGRRLRLTVEHGHHGTASIGGIGAHPGEQIMLGDVALAGPRSITGRVVDTAGDPVPDALVRLIDMHEPDGFVAFDRVWQGLDVLSTVIPLRSDIVAETSTGLDGTFVMNDIVEEWPTFDAVKAGYLFNGSEVKSRDRSEFVLHVARARSIAGVVVDIDGTPIPSAGVCVGVNEERWLPIAWPAITSADGAFRLDVPDTGEYALLADAASFKRGVFTDVDPAEASHTLQLERLPVLEVHAQSADGEPIQRFDVWWQLAGNTWEHVSGRRGTATIDVMRSRQCMLYATAGNGLASEVTEVRDLPTEQTTAVEVILEESPALVGIVRDAETQAPIRGAELAVTTIERYGSYLPIPSGSSAADGSFSLEGLPAGKFRLEVRTPEHVTKYENVITRQVEPLTFELEPSGTICVNVASEDMNLPGEEPGVRLISPYTSSTLRWTLGGSPVVVFAGLKPETYLVQLRVEGSPSHEVTVLPRRMVHVDL